MTTVTKQGITKASSAITNVWSNLFSKKKKKIEEDSGENKEMSKIKEGEGGEGDEYKELLGSNE